MKQRFTFETVLWIMAAAIALLVRVVHLGLPGLNDSEAHLALQAVNLANGNTILETSHPLYVLLTGTLISFFGATPFLARFLPMLAGSGLVGVLYLSRKQLGRWTSLLAAILAAIDPGFVAASRQVDSPIIGMFLLFLFLALILNRKHLQAGAVLGLGILSGFNFWQGVFYLLVCGSFYQLLSAKGENGVWTRAKETIKEFMDAGGWKSYLGSTLLVATLMLTVPNGAGEVLTGLVSYWQGWGASFSNSLTQFIVLLPAYEFLFLIVGIGFGVFSILQGNRRAQFLMLFFLITLIITLAYPSRNVLDMIWVVLPLLLLTAEAMHFLLTQALRNWLPSAGLGLAVAILITFALYSGLLLFTQGALGQNQEIRIISLVGALVVAAILIILMAWTWSGPTGIAGLGMGLLALGLSFTVGQSFRASGLGAFPELELWRNSSRTVNPDLLVSTLESISTWNNGVKNDTPIAVVGADSPSLRWELRNFNRADYYSAFPAGETPVIVITSILNSPASPSSYTGQDLVWVSDAEWSSLTPQEWLNWFLKRSIPGVDHSVIVWGRTDIMPVGQSGTGELP